MGKLALTEDEKFASNLVGGFIIAGLVNIIGYFFSGAEFILFLGIWFILMLIPLGGVFGMEAGSKARKYLSTYSLVLGGLGLAFILIPNIIYFAYAFLLGIFLYGWVANYLVMKAAKEV